MTKIRIDKLLRSNRHTFGLEITQEAELVVRVPYHVSQKNIENIILKKSSWILEKQKFFQQRKREYHAKIFINGESFYYLGKPYRLKLINEEDIRITDYLEFPRCLLSNARENLIQWYKTRAYEKIKERVDLYSGIIGLPYAAMKISSAQKRLGSCNVKGNLNFNWRLITAPLETIDYVVVHELIHLEEMNHSHRFWNKVGIILPDYKKHKALLKESIRMSEF